MRLSLTLSIHFAKRFIKWVRSDFEWLFILIYFSVLGFLGCLSLTITSQIRGQYPPPRFFFAFQTKYKGTMGQKHEETRERCMRRCNCYHVEFCLKMTIFHSKIVLSNTNEKVSLFTEFKRGLIYNANCISNGSLGYLRNKANTYKSRARLTDRLRMT